LVITRWQYTFTHKQYIEQHKYQTNNTNNNCCGRVRAVFCLCEFYPGICLTTEEKARINLSQCKKNLSQVKKNLSQSTEYIYQNTHTLQNPHKHTHYKTYTYTHVTKPSQRHTLQNLYIHTHYKTHTNTHVTKHIHTHTHEHTQITKQYKTTTVQIKTKWNVEAKHSSSDPVSNIIYCSNPKVTITESKKT
jgi:hypothetical protein